MGKIYARLIYAGKRTLDEVPKKYRKDTVIGYHEIYGVWLVDPDEL